MKSINIPHYRKTIFGQLQRCKIDSNPSILGFFWVELLALPPSPSQAEGWLWILIPMGKDWPAPSMGPSQDPHPKALPVAGCLWEASSCHFSIMDCSEFQQEGAMPWNKEAGMGSCHELGTALRDFCFPIKNQYIKVVSSRGST